MCGIVGYWALDGGREDLRRGLTLAVRALNHRGPDSQGTWHNGDGVGLGHTRLAILDVTQSGAQPMVAHDAEIAVVFNGEIYNFKEIAVELAAKGHVIVTRSDTEVVLAAYREWGPSCVEHFIGMFAFAIWDGPQKCLRLFRDRIGVKPFHYGWDGRVLCFASELKALRALPHWSAEIDQTALGEFLQYGYIGAPRTIYRQIRKLSPGHWLHFEIGGEPRITSYWTLTDVLRRGEFKANAAALESELEDLLGSAFRYRMVSDVPVALFLSGGVDSSLVAALLRHSGVEIEAFTIGFESSEHDELPAASKVANHLGLKHHAARISQSEASKVLAQWPSLYDEPFGDHSGIPTYLVARLAKERVKVALSADGGDELFCGYSGYPEIGGRMALHGRISAPLRKSAGQVLSRIRAGPAMNLARALTTHMHASLGHGLVFDRFQKMAGYLTASSGYDAIRPFRSFFQPPEISSLLGIPYRDPRVTAASWPGRPMEQLTAVDLHEYLPDDVLTKVDRSTMAVGLEAREPLLDHRVVEFAFRLPQELRYGPLGNKHILRNILYRHIPRTLVDRPKQGFSVPIRDWMSHWLSTGQVRESIDLLWSRMPLFDKGWLEGELYAFSGSDQGKNRLWLLYVLSQWAEKWV